MSSSTPQAAASGPCLMDVGSSMESLGTLASSLPLIRMAVVAAVRECR
jgi:hypothetical protein